MMMATAASSHRALAMNVARSLFLMTAMLAAIWSIWHNWPDIAAAAARLTVLDMLLAAIAAGGFAITSCLAWRTLIADQASLISFTQTARIFFLGQIGKFIPGGIWQFVASAELGRDAGITRAAILASFAYALIASLIAGAAVVLLSVPQVLAQLSIPPVWIIVTAIIATLGLVGVALTQPFKRLREGSNTPPVGRFLAAIALSILTWLFGGLHIWLLARGIGIPAELSDIWLLTGCYAAAWIAGFLVIIAPAGVGAREVTLIALLAISMPVPEATIIALLSRVITTLVDLVAAALALAFTHPPTSPPAAPPRLLD